MIEKKTEISTPGLCLFPIQGKNIEPCSSFADIGNDDGSSPLFVPVILKNDNILCKNMKILAPERERLYDN
jgi:hypothetical protein